jgi:2-dehydro-3-deoxyphosphogluconate aldolase/(4S)-4-hydroxy-2-oxoglutarate aldolase
MTKEEVRKRILEIGIVPVVRGGSPEHATTVCRAVCDGGIPIVEITMTVPGAIDLIRQMVKSIGDRVLIGAGTVIDAESAAQCLDAGAKFLVSPGFDAETVALARNRQTLIMPGALTPTEVIAAWKSGADFVKVFPCGNVGGPSYIKALKAALPQVPLIPTGGVNLSTAAQFFDAGASAVGVGGDLVTGDAAKIATMAGEYAAVIRNARK